MVKSSIFVVFTTFMGLGLVWASPFGGGSIGYNPNMGGVFTGGGSSPPPFYNPGVGNLMPSFSYTQPQSFNVGNQNQLNPPPTLIEAEAQKVIGKWRQKIANARDNYKLVQIGDNNSIEED